MKTVNLTIPGQYLAGLGDAILWAWLAEGSGGQLQIHARDGLRQMLELCGQTVAETTGGMIDPSNAYRRELADLGRQPRIHYVCRHLGIETRAKRPTITIDPVDVNPLRVALCPHSHGGPRRWPAGYWIDLNWKLLDAGYQPIWQMGHDDPAFTSRGPAMAWWGGSFVDVARRLASCAVVVGNDSMPCHLAGTIGRPTIALMGPTKRTTFSHIPEVECLTSLDTACTGCHFGKPFRACCDSLCESLARLSPAVVFNRVVEKLGAA